MALIKELAEQKLTQLWHSDETPILDIKNNKYAIVSDTHMGDGGNADEFFPNAETMQKTLEFYREQGYTLILLGDVEEFWQFDLAQIVAQYDHTIYATIRSFGDDRVIRIFGNHDAEWGYVHDPTKNTHPRRNLAEEALKLRDGEGNLSIFLVHGHQGSDIDDKSGWVSRFFVRMFKSIKPVAKMAGLYGNPSATKSQITNDYEKILYNWAKQSKLILICGHTHRAIFASKSYGQRLEDEIRTLQAEIVANRTNPKLLRHNFNKIYKLRKKLREEKFKDRDIDPTEPHGEALPCYFNSGCALYTDGVTTIEIEGDEIRLVKWQKDAHGLPRFESYGSGSISEFYGRIVRGDGSHA